MVRIILGAIAGFFAWSIVWVGTEKIFSALWPAWYGAHQTAFEAAIKSNGQFTPDTTILVMNVVRGAIVCVMAGFLAALIAGENKRSPLLLAILLLAFDLLIIVLSWRLVPIWYGVIFTAMLVPMTIIGGKLKSTT